MMKVLYDHQTFTMQDYGGISRVFTEIIKSQNSKSFSKELSILLSNNDYLKEVGGIKYLNFLKNYQWKYKVRVMQEVNKIYSIGLLKKSSFDIFHPTYYDPYFLKHLKRKPFVITFLDLIHEKYQGRYEVFSKDRTVMEGKKTMLTYASKIIAISESTKRDIVEVYGIDSSKIEVVYLANSLEKQVVKAAPVVQGEYILFIGKRDIYKNFSFFLEAISPILKGDKSLKLICGGGGKFTQEEDNLIQSLYLERQVKQQPFHEDDTLVNLYSNALCFAFPSLYEGFGIPVLEAFACGCPCVISNRSSLPEVGGNATIYFNPEDSNSIYNAIASLLSDKRLQQQCKSRGFERLSSFSWERAIQQTFEAYRALL